MARSWKPRHDPRATRLAPLQQLSALARALQQLQVAAPLRLLPGRSGRTLSVGPDDRNRPVFARLSGTVSPYSWTEQRWRQATHDWENRPGGHSGTTNAYEINDFAGLDTMVVPIYRGSGGKEYTFRWNRIVTPPPPPIECSNCILHWPSTLTLKIGSRADVTLTKQSSLSGTGYVGCEMVSGVSGWDWSAYGCGGSSTCDVPLFWTLECATGGVGRSKKVVISSSFIAADPTFSPSPPCPTSFSYGTPACSVRCNNGAIVGVGNCAAIAPGCGDSGFGVGVGCGGFFGSPQQCYQDYVRNGDSVIDLPDGFDCSGAIDLLFPAMTTLPWHILAGSPHVTG